MKTVQFANWNEVLESAALPDAAKKSYRITIRWYLSYCHQQHCPACFDSARAFMAAAMQQKSGMDDWVYERWREGIRWFFRNGQQVAEVEEAAEDYYAPLPTPAEPTHSPTHSPIHSPTHSPAGSVEVASGAIKTMRLQRAEPEWRLQLLTVLRRRHMSYRTETTYVGWVLRFARFLGTDDLRAVKVNAINAYMDYLARDQRVAASTQRQALNALVFLYREVFGQDLGDFAEYRKAYGRKRVAVVLSQAELQTTFAQLKSPYNLMAQLQYGAGLRVSELCRLRVKDLDFDRCILTVRGGKGDEDRVAQLPKVLHVALRQQMEFSRKLYQLDRKQGLAGVSLSESLARKYPNAGTSWPWQWLWPMRGISSDPRAPAVQRRHHILDRAYQRALHRAVTAAGITKRVTSHALRHSYATHLLENGNNVRAVQELLGHKNLETTRRYLHLSTQSDARVVTSPLELLAQ